MIFSILIGLVPMKDTLIGKILCGTSKEDYIVFEDVIEDLEWKSIKEDKKNIRKDYENIIRDMNISISEYKNGKKKS